MFTHKSQKGQGLLLFVIVVAVIALVVFAIIVPMLQDATNNINVVAHCLKAVTHGLGCQ